MRDRLGPLEILIAHASGSLGGHLEKTSPEQFERSWRTAAFGAFLCAREAVSDMLKLATASPSCGGRDAGAMLFTGATSSVRGRGGAVAFCSAKFAVRGLAQSLAVELWPKGIHVAHVIIDGVIDTRKVRKTYKPSAKTPCSSLTQSPTPIGILSSKTAAHGAWKSICGRTKRPFSNDSI